MEKKILELKNKKYISIIGMEKNVGKTTILNYILSKSKGITLGLTSIGRDGEDEDIVTKTNKPRIYIQKGTVICTVKKFVLQSDITLEILENSGIRTPLGEVIVCRALSDGYIEIAGPSNNKDTEKIMKKMDLLGCELIIVDGAVSKKMTSSPEVTKGTILCTGLSLDRDMNKVIEKTAYRVKVLKLKEVNLDIKKIINTVEKKHKVIHINTKGIPKTIKVETILGLEHIEKVIESLEEYTRYLIVKGVVVDSTLEYLMKSIKFKNITLVVMDGTKIFASEEVFEKYSKKCGEIKVVNKINIMLVTINPNSPKGYTVDSEEFRKKLEHKINIPVIDVKKRGDTY